MTKYSEEVRNQLFEAVQFAQREKEPNIAKIAREFNVPYRTLHARLSKPPSTSTSRIPHNKTLEEYQNEALKQWIAQMDNIHLPVTTRMVTDFANRALFRAGSEKRVSKWWPYRFAKTLPPHLQLKPMKQKTKEKKRLTAENTGFLQFWYHQLSRVVENLPPRLIYNFDECGFQPGQCKSQHVLGSSKRPPPDLPEAEKTQNISAVECIAADGWVMTPLFIFAGEKFMESWYTHDNFPNYYTAVSEKGYINDQLALDWLKKFHEETSVPERLKKNEKRVLLFDGHTAHLTLEFLQFCEEKEIIPFGFKPHTTHLCQPLDGNPFLTYKNRFYSQNNEISQYGGVPAGKSDFLKDITAVREKTFTQRIIRHSFKKHGIFPVNASLIIQPLLNKLSRNETSISELHKYEERTPSRSPDIGSSNIENTPPKSAEAIEKNKKKRSRLLPSDSITPKLQRHLDRTDFHLKRTQEELTMMRDTVKRMREMQAPRMRNTTRRQVPNLSDSGILTVNDANRSIEASRKKRIDQEEKRLQKQLEKVYGKRTPNSDSTSSQKASSQAANPAHSTGQEH